MTTIINAGISDTSATTGTPNDAEHAGLWFAYTAEAGLPEAISGYRSINTIYRQTAKMKEAGTPAIPNVMVRVPTPHLTEQTIIDNVVELAPYVLAYLQKEEDDYTKAQHKAGASRMHNNITYTKSAQLTRLVKAGMGPQLTEEQIAEWFTTEISVALAVGLAAKYFPSDDAVNLTEDKQVKLNALVSGFLNKFLELADSKTEHIVLADREQMVKAIEIAEASTTTLGGRFLARFKEMAAEDAGTLGGL